MLQFLLHGWIFFISFSAKADVIIQAHSVSSSSYETFLKSHPEHIDFVESYLQIHQEVPEPLIALARQAHHLSIDGQSHESYVLYQEVYEKIKNEPIFQRHRRLYLRILYRLVELSQIPSDRQKWIDEIQLNISLAPDETKELLKDLSNGDSNIQYFKKISFNEWNLLELFPSSKILFVNGVEFKIQDSKKVPLSPLAEYQFILLSDSHVPITVQGHPSDLIEKTRSPGLMLEGECLNPMIRFPILGSLRMKGYFHDRCLVDLSRATFEPKEEKSLETNRPLTPIPTSSQTYDNRSSMKWLIPVLTIIGVGLAAHNLQGKRVVFTH